MNEIDHILKWIGEVTQFDVFKIAEMIRTKNEHYNGTLCDYELREPLVQAIKCYMDGDDAATYERLHTFIKGFLSLKINDFSADNIRRKAEIFRGSVEHLSVCESRRSEWFAAIRDELGNIYNPEDHFSPFTLYKLKNSIGGRHLHLFRYAGDGNVDNCKQFTIADGIVASSEISDLIAANSKDQWRVTMGLCIEPTLAMSYFVLSFSIKNNVFVLSDRYDYENPDQVLRFGSRGGGRRMSEGRENALEFPYVLIDRIEEKRRNNNSLTKQVQREIYTFPITEFVDWRLYFYCKFTIEAIIQGTAEILSLNQKALAAPVDIADNSHFLQTNIEKLEKIANEIFSDTCTDLVVQTSEILAVNNVSTALMTTDDVQRFSQYLVHKNIVDSHYKGMCPITQTSVKEDFFKHCDEERRFYDFLNSQEEELHSLFRSKVDALMPYLFCGDVIHITDIDHPHTFGFMDSSENERSEDIFVGNGYALRGCVNDVLNYKEQCLLCGKNANADKFCRTFNFKRYTEIITLLGISRNDLPSLYRDYLSYDYIPYTGNSILHNVKPEFNALGSDYVSNHNQNQLGITFAFCGHCYKQLLKKYRVGNEVLIEISSKQHKVLQIKPL